MRQKVAVVGSGISGLGVAWVLSRAHEVDLFEAGDRIGGHVHTHDLELEGRSLAVDSGFIVFNEPNYPLFNRLLNQLAVPFRTSTMSFSVKDEASGLEYNGRGPGGLFVQKRNLFSPTFHRMLRDILRFNREGKRLAAAPDTNLGLGRFLRDHRFGGPFVRHYLHPMASALWSANPAGLDQFPAQALVRFFDNHRMLDLKDRPAWRTVSGGSREYVRALLKALPARVHLHSPVGAIRRNPQGVELHFPAQPPRYYDQVVLAVHSDQALALLADGDVEEQGLLGAIPYQPNPTVLHTDASILPRDRRAWAAWNSRIPARSSDRATVSYLMNELQGLPVSTPAIVSLNSEQDLDPALILRRMEYRHPVFTVAGLEARRRLQARNGHNRTWFCGAWFGNGFHEDGLASAMAVCSRFGLEL